MLNYVKLTCARTIFHRDLANEELRRKQDIQGEEKCPNQRCRQAETATEVHAMMFHKTKWDEFQVY